METNDIIKKLTDSAELKALVEKVASEVKKEEKKGKYIEYEMLYYYINIAGSVNSTYWTNHQVDQSRLEINNVFLTEEEAKAKVEFLKTERELMLIADELNNGENIDWRDLFQRKYYLTWDCGCEELTINFTSTCRGTNIYCLKIDIKQTALKRIGKKRLKQYLTYRQEVVRA